MKAPGTGVDILINSTRCYSVCAGILACLLPLSVTAQTAKKDPAAQQKTTAPAPPAEQIVASQKSIDIERFPLSPNDVIQIQVDNLPNVGGTYIVPSGGKLLLPDAGEVLIAGRTVKQVRDAIQAELDKTLNNINVLVLLKEVHSRKVAVVGYVQRQGTIDMGTSELKVLDAIDASGSFSSPINRGGAEASDYIVTLFRGPAVINVDIQTIYKHPDSASNLVVLPNDRIVVELKPVVTHTVHLLGRIPRPGGYPLDNNTTVLGLFASSGYPDSTASLSKSYVLRGPQQIPLDLRPLLTGNMDVAVSHFKFVDDDVLYIPEVKTSFMVWGQVGRQGNFPYPEAGKVMLLDAINMAGQSPTGDYKKVHVLRTVDGKQNDTTIDLEKMVRLGIMKDNIALQPNDIVWVGPKPRKKFAPTLQDVFLPLTMLNYLGLRPF